MEFKNILKKLLTERAAWRNDAKKAWNTLIDRFSYGGSNLGPVC